MQEKPTNLDVWKAAITDGSSGTRKPVAPVVICMNTLKGGLTVSDIWQTNYAKLVGNLGGSFEFQDHPNDDHFSLPNSCAPDARQWLNGLF